LAGKSCIKVHIADREIDGLVRTYGERPVGEFVALIDSSGRLSVCVVNGNAAAELNIRQGEQIEVIFQPEEPA
jgi:S-adenosylmethionine hydrolase